MGGGGGGVMIIFAVTYVHSNLPVDLYARHGCY